MYIYKTSGVCAKEITFSVEDNLLKDVKFYAGCPGSLQGISSLIKGMEIDEAIRRLQGISCGGKSTSCPDQLARALTELKKVI